MLIKQSQVPVYHYECCKGYQGGALQCVLGIRLTLGLGGGCSIFPLHGSHEIAVGEAWKLQNPVQIRDGVVISVILVGMWPIALALQVTS